jgi:hypothetical protein
MAYQPSASVSPGRCSVDPPGQAAHGDAAQLEPGRSIVDHQHHLPIVEVRGDLRQDPEPIRVRTELSPYGQDFGFASIDERRGGSGRAL